MRCTSNAEFRKIWYNVAPADGTSNGQSSELKCEPQRLFSLAEDMRERFLRQQTAHDMDLPKWLLSDEENSRTHAQFVAILNSIRDKHSTPGMKRDRLPSLRHLPAGLEGECPPEALVGSGAAKPKSKRELALEILHSFRSQEVEDQEDEDAEHRPRKSTRALHSGAALRGRGSGLRREPPGASEGVGAAPEEGYDAGGGEYREAGGRGISDDDEAAIKRRTRRNGPGSAIRHRGDDALSDAGEGARDPQMQEAASCAHNHNLGFRDKGLPYTHKCARFASIPVCATLLEDYNKCFVNGLLHYFVICQCACVAETILLVASY